MAKPNLYFPCDIIEQDDGYSIVCSHFHYFDDHFGERDCGGYSVERLAKKLVKEHAIQGIKFDSEAGMFCAYSDKSRSPGDSASSKFTQRGDRETREQSIV